MSSSLILHKCIKCGKERMIQKHRPRGPKFTGLCYKCSMAETYKRLRNRPVNKRPIIKRPDGYLEIYLPENHWCLPMAEKTRRRIMVHRLVMAEHLGRLLRPDELVHHKNGVKDDNRISNLELTTLSKHGLSYQDGYTVGLKDGIYLRDRELEKQIRILRLQIRGLTERLQVQIPFKEEACQE